MDLFQENFKWSYQNIKIPLIAPQCNDYSSDIKQILLHHIKKNKKAFSLYSPKSKKTDIIENKKLPKNKKTKKPILIINSIKINHSHDKLKMKTPKPIENNLNSNENNGVTYKTSTTQTIDESEIPKITKRKKFFLYSKNYFFSDVKNDIFNFNEQNFNPINKEYKEYNDYSQSFKINNKSKAKISSIGTSFSDYLIKKNKKINKECAIKYIDFDCNENNKFLNNFLENKKLKRLKENSKTTVIFEKNIGKLRKKSERKENFYNCYKYITRNKTVVNKKKKIYKIQTNKTSDAGLSNSNNKMLEHFGSNVNFNLYNINVNNLKIPLKNKNNVVGNRIYDYNSKNPRISLQTLNLIQAVCSS